MTSHTWDFDGERSLGNYFDHWFVRSALSPGWSAAQGGPGPSSHTRDEKTQTYLRRPCVNNPTGGPQENPASAVHRLKAEKSLAEVDALRRKEYARRRERAAVDEKLRVQGLNNDIRRNWGWPFDVGLPPREPEESMEEPTELFPKKELPDWDKDWDREPFGRILVKEDSEKKKTDDPHLKEDSKTEDPDSKTVDPHFHPWVGSVGWQDGYLQHLKAKVDENGETTREEGWYWTGPERAPALLDQFLWKPAARAGPAVVNALGANKTVEAIQLGRPLETPEELERKRVYNHTRRAKDVVKGGYKHVNFGDGKYFETNIEVPDPLTGIPMYSYQQKLHTKTSSKGHGTLDRNVLLDRKQKKVVLMQKQVDEFKTELEDLEHANRKTKRKYEDKDMTRTQARDKIIANNSKAEKITKQCAEYQSRIDREKREIKAIETELELDEAGKGVWVPRTLKHAMPKEALTTMKQALTTVRQVGEAVGLVQPVEEEEEFYESPDSDSDAEERHGVIAAFFMGYNRQKRKGMKTEKYFGKNLIDPATGKIDEAVLKRKNMDLIAQQKEFNKAVTDVYLSRSDGTSKFNTTNFVPPEKRRVEREERKDQQEMVDAFVKVALETKTSTPLEEWASSEQRKESVFGSSEHKRPKPVMQMNKVRDGNYMMFKTLASPPSQVKEDGVVLPASAVSTKCSSGKVFGGGAQNPRYELVGLGPEDIDHRHFESPHSGFQHLSADHVVSANITFAGRRVDARAEEAQDRGPLRPGLIMDRKFKGVKEEEEGGGGMVGRVGAVGGGLAKMGGAGLAGAAAGLTRATSSLSVAGLANLNKIKAAPGSG